MTKGEVEPKGWTLQPWRKLKRRNPEDKGVNGFAKGDSADGSAQPHPAICASAIAKYVFKKGRLTIPPARVLEGSGLLPSKPAGEPESGTITPMPNGHSDATGGIVSEPPLSLAGEMETREELLDGSLIAVGDEGDEWTWPRVEEERVRGMKLAGLFNDLDGLNGEFRGGEDNALGVFLDLI